jgi:hypothetical protein
MIRPVSILIAASIAIVSAPVAWPAAAQDRSEATNPGQFGLMATTPSRMDRSRREMNRGREQVWDPNMSASQTRSYAQRALRRGGFDCEVADAVLVAQARDGTPLVEVDCAQGGGLVIADTEPMMATDCLDLVPGAGMETNSTGPVEACRLPGNVASVAAERQSARN